MNYLINELMTGVIVEQPLALPGSANNIKSDCYEQTKTVYTQNCKPKSIEIKSIAQIFQLADKHSSESHSKA